MRAQPDQIASAVVYGNNFIETIETTYQEKHSMKTRRQFLAQSSIAALAAAVIPGAAFARSQPGRLASISGQCSLDYTTFSELVQTAFRVKPAAQRPANLVLVAARQRSTCGMGECFSLLFRGPLKSALSQNTYRFEHDRLGSFDMFIVPKPADDRSVYYEAVFNRIA